MPKYHLTEVAQDDLAEIRDRILGQSGPIVAKRMLLELQGKLELLSNFPNMGRARPDLTEHDVFFFPFYSWMVVYLPESQPLTVVRFVSSYQDPSKFFP